MQVELLAYTRPDGTTPYARWFARLDVQAARKVQTALLRVELGNSSNIKWYSGIGELKIDWGPGYRVYLARDGDRIIVLFGGGTKATQSKDIARAMALHAEFKARAGTQRKGDPELE